MRTADPFPEQAVLTLTQTARLVGMTPADFRDFIKDPTNGFPPSSKRFGKTKNKRPRLMWFKWKVLAWLDFQAMQEEGESTGSQNKNPDAV